MVEPGCGGAQRCLFGDGTSAHWYELPSGLDDGCAPLVVYCGGVRLLEQNDTQVGMPACTYTHIHTHTYIHTHIHTHTGTHARTHTYA